MFFAFRNISKYLIRKRDEFLLRVEETKRKGKFYRKKEGRGVVGISGMWNA